MCVYIYIYIYTYMYRERYIVVSSCLTRLDRQAATTSSSGVSGVMYPCSAV